MGIPEGESMGLIAFLVAAPLIVAALLMLFRSNAQRKVITVAGALVTGVASVAFAASYLASGQVFFELSQDTSYLISIVMTAIDILLCAVILWFAVRYKNRLALVLGLVQTVGVILFANMALGAGAEHMLVEPLYTDELSVIMTLIIGLVGSAICVYALGYMKDFQHHEPAGAPDRRHFFSALMFLFLSAMYVIIFSDNLEWMFTGWEITTTCSFLMIGYTRTEEALKSAFRQIILNMIGGIAFLFALILIHVAGLELSLSGIIADAGTGAVALLVLLFCCSRSPALPRRLRCRSIRGCSAPWSRPRPRARCSTPPRWSRQASSCSLSSLRFTWPFPLRPPWWSPSAA